MKSAAPSGGVGAQTYPRSGLRSLTGARSAQPEEGVEITEPEDDGETVEEELTQSRAM